MYWVCSRENYRFLIIDDFERCVTYRMSYASYKDAFSGYEALCEFCETAFVHQDRIMKSLSEFRNDQIIVPCPCRKTHIINFRSFLTDVETFRDTEASPCMMLDEDYNAFYALKTSRISDGMHKCVSICEAKCSLEYMVSELMIKVNYLKCGMKQCLENIWNKMVSCDDMNKIADDACHFVQVTPS